MELLEGLSLIKDELKFCDEMSLIVEDEKDKEDIKHKLLSVEQELNKLQLQLAFKNPEDSKNAIVEINAGAGGTDAKDFAEMLFKMYCKWADKKGQAYICISCPLKFSSLTSKF